MQRYAGFEKIEDNDTYIYIYIFALLSSQQSSLSSRITVSRHNKEKRRNNTGTSTVVL
jgi:hypothetical protein